MHYWILYNGLEELLKLLCKTDDMEFSKKHTVFHCMDCPDCIICRHASISQLKGSTLWREHSMHFRYLYKLMQNLDGLHLLRLMVNGQIVRVTDLVVASKSY